MSLIAAIRTFIDARSERCEPFAWTKTADEILAKATSGGYSGEDLQNASA